MPNGWPVAPHIFGCWASGYGTFVGNSFVADHSEDTEDRNVTIQAAKSGSSTLSKNITVRNIDMSTVDLGGVDFIVVRYSWVPVSGRDLDIMAGIEHSDMELQLTMIMNEPEAACAFEISHD